MKKKPQQFIFNQLKSEKSDFLSLNFCQGLVLIKEDVRYNISAVFLQTPNEDLVHVLYKSTHIHNSCTEQIVIQR